jgi:hypothetical protein
VETKKVAKKVNNRKKITKFWYDICQTFVIILDINE